MKKDGRVAVFLIGDGGSLAANPSPTLMIPIETHVRRYPPFPGGV